MRAAEAAKNTASLIATTVEKVQSGSDVVTKANSAFDQVKETASKAAEIVTEIATASNEQAEGIEQINKAIAQMDKVIQQNAANAEESASASEEMNAQAEQMKSVVRELVAMVGGEMAKDSLTEKNTATSTTKVPSTGPTPKKKPAHRSRVVKPLNSTPDPEQLIPFDGGDSDFEDF